MAPGPEGDVAELLDIIRGTDSDTEEKGWELFCRKVFLSEQEGQGSLLDFDLNWSEDEDYEEDAEDSDHDEAAFIARFAHEQTDDILFLVEMRCAKEEKKVLFAYGHFGSMTNGQFGFFGNSYTNNGTQKEWETRVVLDESHGIQFQGSEEGECNWSDCMELANAFKCTIRAVVFGGEDGYHLTTLVNDGQLTYYYVHQEEQPMSRYQCILPGIQNQITGGEDELFLRFEFNQTQMYLAWNEEELGVRPTSNVIWMHGMNLTFHKGPHALLSRETARDNYMQLSGFGNSPPEHRDEWNHPDDVAAEQEWYDAYGNFGWNTHATIYDVLSALNSMGWT